jgi:hypothetical protein
VPVVEAEGAHRRAAEGLISVPFLASWKCSELC